MNVYKQHNANNLTITKKKKKKISPPRCDEDRDYFKEKTTGVSSNGEMPKNNEHTLNTIRLTIH